MFNLVLSMLPSKILKIFEMIGFSGGKNKRLRKKLI